jgi:hypothetical protein
VHESGWVAVALAILFVGLLLSAIFVGRALT